MWDWVRDLIARGNPWQIAASLMGLYFGCWAAMIYMARLTRPMRNKAAAWYRERRRAGGRR